MLKRLFERIRSSPEQDRTDRPAFVAVGLGNPGKKYTHTRHNVGFMTIDRLAKDLPEGRERQRFQSIVLETSLDHHRLILAKPLTYMNNSGSAVAQIQQWYKVPLDRLLIIHDDLDLPFGRIRLRPEGGAGGHNGLSSIIESLGSQEFPRLRIGIGRPTSGTTINYVLQPFDRAQREQLPELLDLSTAAVRAWITCGISEAMNEYNRRELSPQSDRVD